MEISKTEIEKFLSSIPDKFDDKNTTSKKMKRDIFNFFNKNEFRDLICVEIGSYYGYTTKILSYLFKEVYGFNCTTIGTKKCNETNFDRHNVKIFAQDIYNTKFPIDNGDVFFIDAIHTYDAVLIDTLRSLTMKSIDKKYFIYDDYGLISDVKFAIQSLILDNKIEILEYIGYSPFEEFTRPLSDYEGVICREK